jgi:hypothetical protein
MADLKNPAAVATIVLESEAELARLRSNTYSMQWGGQKVTKFKETKVPHVKNDDLCLPTLYLHFLDQAFRVEDGQLDRNLRAGNDMSEVVIKIQEKYFTDSFAGQCGELREEVATVVGALREVGEVLVSSSDRSQSEANAGTFFYALRTARPKAGISLPKPAFGIPDSADQYLFVNNHESVIHFDEKIKDAFNACIGGLPDIGSTDAAKFATFLKVFYEGGFGYNKKIMLQGGYLPKNVGIAAMSVVPAFEGQLGIGTGYPYKLPSKFLPFIDTVPISIDAIRTMSERHGRYGLAFTNCVFVWEGDSWQTEKALSFISVLPHGGFFYVPATLSEHKAKGGLVYAFGESTSDSQQELTEHTSAGY